MKSIVFSNFDSTFFNEELKPILEKCGVEIISSLGFEEPPPSDEFDSVISFQDMTIKLQRDVAKHFARLTKKSCILLSKKSPDLEKDILDAVNKFNNKSPSLPPVSSPIASLPEVTEVTEPPEIDNLQEMLTKQQELIVKLQEVINEKDEYITLCESTNARLTADSQANSATVIDLRNKNKILNTKIDKFNELMFQRDKIIIEKDGFISLYENEIKKLNLEKESNYEMINDLDRQNRSLLSNVKHIRTSISAIRMLNQQKLLSNTDTLERIFDILENFDES